jgi:hypothetical protein
MNRSFACLVAIVLAASAGTALAQQPMPTSQPNFLQIYREDVKVGHAADHAKVEAGWPAAYEKAKDPYTYIALVSLTGPGEAWFITPFASQAAMEDSMKRENDPMLAGSLERLSRSDADQISGVRSILAMARKDLSHGPYPDTAKQRYYEITVFRVKPGHSRDFEAAAKAYGAATDRAAPENSYRVYEVMAGMPSPTFLVFSSVTSYGAFDKSMADDGAIMKSATAEERSTLEKFSAEGAAGTETIRFRLDPRMSYVTQEVRAQDPDFWQPKAAPTVVATSGTKPKAKK